MKSMDLGSRTLLRKGDRGMAKPLVVEGELVLWWAPGGDSWCIDNKELDDIVAEYFGAERAELSGNRHIGRVRITMERIVPSHALEEEER